MNETERIPEIDAHLLRLVESGAKPYLALIRAFADMSDRRLAMRRLHALDRDGQIRSEIRHIRPDKPALWFGPAPAAEAPDADV